MNEKLTGMLLGVILTVGILSILGFAAAHGNNGNIIENGYGGIIGHMGPGMMMHGMHHENDEHDNTEHIEGCPMMNGNYHEEMDLEDMDQDGDGLCDMCGIPVDECLEMHSSNTGMMGHHMI